MLLTEGSQLIDEGLLRRDFFFKLDSRNTEGGGCQSGRRQPSSSEQKMGRWTP